MPLCGKTRDIGWLLSQVISIAGAELSTIAVDQLFDELGVVPTVTHAGKLLHYRAANIDIYAGDVFDVSRQMLGEVDAVYDRAAFVALPAEMRLRYSAHMAQLTGKARQLLIVYEYEQGAMAGPPFSIGAAELAQHYIDRNGYRVTLLGSVAITGGFKGTIAAVETAWLLA